jgi:hypothetical protein
MASDQGGGQESAEDGSRLEGEHIENGPVPLSQIRQPQFGAGEETDQPDGQPLHHPQIFQHTRWNDPGH